MKTILTAHQQEIYEAIVSRITQNLSSAIKSNNIEDHFLSLSGPAGTGKSFLTAHILQSLMGVGNICATAPTNKAVKVLRDMINHRALTAECRTIHSFLNIRPFIDYNTGEEKFKILRTKKSPPQASLLIIDESSMVSQDLYSFIVEAYHRGQVNTVLFIGDPYQLLPVNQSENSIFQLRQQFKLSEIVRQAKDSTIIKLATKIRERIQKQDFINLRELLHGSKTEDIELFGDRTAFVSQFYKNVNWYNEDKILTSFTNSDVDAFNQHIRDHYWHEHGRINLPHILPGDILRFKNTFEYRDNVHMSMIANTILYQNGEEVKIETARFIHRKELPIQYWECTAIGRSKRDFFRVIDPGSVSILNNILNDYVRIAKTSQYPKNKQSWKMYFDLKNAFADVQYIYAATIHKLQGSTFDTIYIDLYKLVRDETISNDLKYRLVYVAITSA